ncbi:hypothetical protein BC830DRAFT_1173910 [Chytriomyces sp. MP71]|nr:hypothetical protein BC830DRAFT_1173910 [Chytriomyces sp. MP71]
MDPAATTRMEDPQSTMSTESRVVVTAWPVAVTIQPTAIQASATTTTIIPAPLVATSPPNSSNKVAIIGGIVAAAIAAFLLIATLTYCIKNRQQHGKWPLPKWTSTQQRSLQEIQAHPQSHFLVTMNNPAPTARRKSRKKKPRRILVVPPPSETRWWSRHAGAEGMIKHPQVARTGDTPLFARRDLDGNGAQGMHGYPPVQSYTDPRWVNGRVNPAPNTNMSFNNKTAIMFLHDAATPGCLPTCLNKGVAQTAIDPATVSALCMLMNVESAAQQTSASSFEDCLYRQCSDADYKFVYTSMDSGNTQFYTWLQQDSSCAGVVAAASGTIHPISLAPTKLALSQNASGIAGNGGAILTSTTSRFDGPQGVGPRPTANQTITAPPAPDPVTTATAPASNSSSSSSSSTNIPTIVGGVATGIVVLSMLVAFIWWRLKRVARETEQRFVVAAADRGMLVPSVDAFGKRIVPPAPYAYPPQGAGFMTASGHPMQMQQLQQGYGYGYGQQMRGMQMMGGQYGGAYRTPQQMGYPNTTSASYYPQQQQQMYGGYRALTGLSVKEFLSTPSDHNPPCLVPCLNGPDTSHFVAGFDTSSVVSGKTVQALCLLSESASGTAAMAVAQQFVQCVTSSSCAKAEYLAIYNTFTPRFWLDLSNESECVGIFTLQGIPAINQIVKPPIFPSPASASSFSPSSSPSFTGQVPPADPTASIQPPQSQSNSMADPGANPSDVINAQVSSIQSQIGDAQAHIVAIVAGSCAAVVALLAIAVACYFWSRRRSLGRGGEAGGAEGYAMQEGFVRAGRYRTRAGQYGGGYTQPPGESTPVSSWKMGVGYADPGRVYESGATLAAAGGKGWRQREDAFSSVSEEGTDRYDGAETVVSRTTASPFSSKVAFRVNQ